MSGKIFKMEAHNSKSDHHLPKSVESKIPVPSSSPISVRRQSSLRLKGERSRTYVRSISKDSKINENISNRPSQTGNGAVDLAGNRRQSAKNPPLQRGYSFMERGEKRADNDGGKSTQRPNSVRICGKLDSNSSQNNGASDSPGRVRSLSLSLSTNRISSPKSPNLSAASPSGHSISPGRIKKYSSSQLDTWDTDSITSIASSVASCDHASVARNGTTFSGRSMKYVFHCNQHAGSTGEDYLTPTQRAHRQVKKLKHLLQQAKKDLEQKDSDILKLTKEVVELRLYKAALNSPEDKSNSSDAVTVRENTSEDVTPVMDVLDSLHNLNNLPNELNSSFADSGHYEDGTNSSVHSNDDYTRSPLKNKFVETCEKGCTAHMSVLDKSSEQSKLIMEYEKRIQELIRMHEEESYHLKQKHNDKVEELLQRITEINGRYWELVPELDAAKERIKELEIQLEEASKKLSEQEDTAKQTYLEMYTKGQTAARMEHENTVMEMARQHPNRVSVPELLTELQVTKTELENIKAMYRQLMEAKSRNKIDPEITLQFLKSAVYYFLTDKENSNGHLKAIQSILGFSPNEISNIDKARLS